MISGNAIRDFALPGFDRIIIGDSLLRTYTANSAAQKANDFINLTFTNNDVACGCQLEIYFATSLFRAFAVLDIL